MPLHRELLNMFKNAISIQERNRPRRGTKRRASDLVLSQAECVVAGKHEGTQTAPLHRSMTRALNIVLQRNISLLHLEVVQKLTS